LLTGSILAAWENMKVFVLTMIGLLALTSTTKLIFEAASLRRTEFRGAISLTRATSVVMSKGRALKMRFVFGALGGVMLPLATGMFGVSPAHVGFGLLISGMILPAGEFF
jgi:hypothetical protein